MQSQGQLAQAEPQKSQESKGELQKLVERLKHRNHEKLSK